MRFAKSNDVLGRSIVATLRNPAFVPSVGRIVRENVKRGFRAS